MRKSAHNATTKLQMYDLHCIEESVRAVHEQIRDRERMRTLDVYMGLRNLHNASVLVEAHFERLVIFKERAQLKVLSAIGFRS